MRCRHGNYRDAQGGLQHFGFNLQPFLFGNVHHIEGDDDRRLVNGMLGSSVTAGAAAPVLTGTQARLELDQ